MVGLPGWVLIDVGGGVRVASVFEDLGSAVATLGRVVADLEPGVLDTTGAKRLVDLFTRAERLFGGGSGVGGSSGSRTR